MTSCRMGGRKLVPLAVVWAAACAAGPAAPSFDPFGSAEVTALFIGNSLTASNDLPALVTTMAEAAGRTFEHRALLRPSYSLADHWRDGAASVIRDLRPDVVVLQQGPSSVGDNPAHLRTWTETYAPVIEEVGGRPALLMVWPDRSRMEAFDAVRDSYAGAAASVGGIFIPAGEAWRAVWQRDPAVELYGPDGFHPSRVGSFVAALTLFEMLLAEDPRALPPGLADPGDATVLYGAAHAAVEAHGFRE